MEDVRDNPYYQALAAFVAEAAAMGVDVDEITRRAVHGFQTGKSYAIRIGDRPATGAAALKETVESYKGMLII